MYDDTWHSKQKHGRRYQIHYPLIFPGATREDAPPVQRRMGNWNGMINAGQVFLYMWHLGPVAYFRFRELATLLTVYTYTHNTLSVCLYMLKLVHGKIQGIPRPVFQKWSYVVIQWFETDARIRNYHHQHHAFPTAGETGPQGISSTLRKIF